MNRKKIVSVRDVKTECFSAPVSVSTIAEGIRLFDDLCKDSSSIYGKHKEDFELYAIGEFDFVTGEFFPALSLIARGSEFGGNNNE